jgi:hypothetical protein
MDFHTDARNGAQDVTAVRHAGGVGVALAERAHLEPTFAASCVAARVLASACWPLDQIKATPCAGDHGGGAGHDLPGGVHYDLVSAFGGRGLQAG